MELEAVDASSVKQTKQLGSLRFGLRIQLLLMNGILVVLMIATILFLGWKFEDIKQTVNLQLESVQQLEEIDNLSNASLLTQAHTIKTLSKIDFLKKILQNNLPLIYFSNFVKKILQNNLPLIYFSNFEIPKHQAFIIAKGTIIDKVGHLNAISNGSQRFEDLPLDPF